MARCTVVCAYLDHLRSLNYSPATLETYGRALDELLSFLAASGRERMADVTAADLDAYRLSLTKRNLAPASQELYLRAARQFFAWLEATQQVFTNPAAGLIVPRPPRKLLPVPTEDEIARLLALPDVATSTGLRDRALLEVAYGCGLRREELVRLDVFDPNLSDGRLRVLGKGSRERVVPLGREAIRWLNQYLKDARPRLAVSSDERALWLTRLGDRLNGVALRQMVWTYAHRAGLPHVSPHALRRACATHMLRNGAHPVQIQLLLGHAGLRHLGQYLRLSIRDLHRTHRNSKPGR